jgi:hypothetical protein
MSLLDGLIGSGSGSVTVKADGIELPKRAKVNFTSDGSLDVDGADASDTSNITLKHGAAGGGALHVTAVATGDVGARHGFLHSDDKRKHDRHHTTAVYFRPTNAHGLSGPAALTAAAADKVAWDAMVAEAETKNARHIYLLDGPIYVDTAAPLDLGTLTNVRIHGAGRKGNTSYLYGVGARSAGAMISCRDNNYMIFDGLDFYPGPFSYTLDCSYDAGGTNGDPTGIVIRNCRFFGNLVGAAGTTIAAKTTSTTSRTLAFGSLAFTLAAASAADYPAGSLVLVVSRGTLDVAFGTVVSLVGTTLTISVDSQYYGDCIGVGNTHSDWDIYLPNWGIYTGITDTFEVENCNFGNLAVACSLQGNGLTWRANNTIVGPRHYQIRAGSSSQGIEVEGGQFQVDPITERLYYVNFGNVQNATLVVSSGDQGKRGPAIALKGSECVTIANGTRIFIDYPGTPAGECAVAMVDTTDCVIESGVRATVTGGYLVASPGASYNLNPEVLAKNFSGTALLHPSFAKSGAWAYRASDGAVYSAAQYMVESLPQVLRAGAVNADAQATRLSLTYFAGGTPAKAWIAGLGPMIAGNVPTLQDANVATGSVFFYPQGTAGAGWALGIKDAAATNGQRAGFIFDERGFRMSLSASKTSPWLEVNTSGNWDFNGAELTDIAIPTAATSAATKSYVDGFAVQGLTDDGSSGTADTINFTSQFAHKSLLDNNVTFTYTFPAGQIGSYIHEIKQDVTGGRTTSLPATILNRVAIEAILNANTTAATANVLCIYWNGTAAIASVMATGVSGL